MLVGATALPAEWRALVVALVMAVLSPVMAKLGKRVDADAPEIERGDAR
jgi:hypothetical protein